MTADQYRASGLFCAWCEKAIALADRVAAAVDSECA